MSGPTLATAYVEILASTKGLAQSIKKDLGLVDGEADRAGRRAGKLYGDGMGRDADNHGRNAGKKMSSGFGSAIAGSATKVFAPLAAAAGGLALFDGLKDSVNLASDLSETKNKLDVVFGPAASAQIKGFAQTAATSLGQTSQQAMDAAAGFGVFGKSAGLVGPDLASFSTDLTSLASDLASFHNTSPEEAIEALGAGLRGEAEPLRKYGVLMDDATMRQEAMKLGLIKSTKEALTPANKVLAARALIMKQTKDAQGDFARTSDGLANSQRIVAAQVTELKTQLGSALLPVVGKVTGFLSSKVLPAFTGFVTGMQNGTGAGGRFVQALKPVGSFLSQVASGAKIVALWVGSKLGPALSSVKAALSSGAKSNFITSLVATFTDLGSKVGRIVTEIIVPRAQQLWNSIGGGSKVVSVLRNVASTVGVVLSGLGQLMSRLIQFLLAGWRIFGDTIVGFLAGAFRGIFTIIQGAMLLIRGVVNTVLGLLTGDWSRMWLGLKQIVGGVFTAIGGVIQVAVAAISGIFGILKDAVVAVFGGMWTWLSTKTSNAVSSLISTFRDWGNSISTFFSGLGSSAKRIWGEMWSSVSTKTAAMVLAIKTAVSGWVTSLVGFVIGLKGRVSAAWSAAWTWLKTSASTAITNAKTAISLTISGIVGLATGIGSRMSAAWSNAWTGLKTKASSILTTAKTDISNKLTAVVGLVSGLKTRITTAASGMFSGMVTSAKNSINGLIRAWNNLSFGVSGMHINIPGAPDIDIPGFSLGTPDIPMLATGGTIRDNGGGWAVVGEQGPELVKLPGAAQVLPNSAYRASRDGAAAVAPVQNITINVHNPVAEPTSRSIQAASQHMALEVA